MVKGHPPKPLLAADAGRASQRPSAPRSATSRPSSRNTHRNACSSTGLFIYKASCLLHTTVVLFSKAPSRRYRVLATRNAKDTSTSSSTSVNCRCSAFDAARCVGMVTVIQFMGMTSATPRFWQLRWRDLSTFCRVLYFFWGSTRTFIQNIYPAPTNRSMSRTITTIDLTRLVYSPRFGCLRPPVRHRLGSPSHRRIHLTPSHAFLESAYMYSVCAPAL